MASTFLQKNRKQVGGKGENAPADHNRHQWHCLPAQIPPRATWKPPPKRPGVGPRVRENSRKGKPHTAGIAVRLRAGRKAFRLKLGNAKGGARQAGNGQLVDHLNNTTKGHREESWRWDSTPTVAGKEQTVRGEHSWKPAVGTNSRPNRTGHQFQVSPCTVFMPSS